MDCEKFDENVIDALYDELDEPTAAAFRRHLDGCARCSQIFANLSHTRKTATLELVQPSADLEARILAAEPAATRAAPIHRKIFRAAAWAGSLAMRPQLAMAALFMLVVGSSLLLLRVRPGTMSSPVQVTQKGEPNSDEAEGKTQRGRATQESVRGDDRAKAAVGGPRESGAEAPAFQQAPEAGAPSMAASASAKVHADTSGPGGLLSSARDLRKQGNCSDALSAYKNLETRYPGSPEAVSAKREATDCRDAGPKLKGTGASASAVAPASPPPPGEEF